MGEPVRPVEALAEVWEWQGAGVTEDSCGVWPGRPLDGALFSEGRCVRAQTGLTLAIPWTVAYSFSSGSFRPRNRTVVS